MRYWYTYDSIFQRIVRTTSELSSVVRNFCYILVLGVVLSQNLQSENGTLSVGVISVTHELVSKLSIPVFLFLLLDILHPLICLICLHLIGISHWKEYKKYLGQEGQPYDEKQDRSELIIEPLPWQFASTAIIPSLLLLFKIISVVWIVLVFAFNIKFS